MSRLLIIVLLSVAASPGDFYPQKDEDKDTSSVVVLHYNSEDSKNYSSILDSPVITDPLKGNFSLKGFVNPLLTTDSSDNQIVGQEKKSDVPDVSSETSVFSDGFVPSASIPDTSREVRLSAIRPAQVQTKSAKAVDIITEPMPGQEYVFIHSGLTPQSRSLEPMDLEEMMDRKKAFHQLQDGGEKDGVESIIIPQYEKIAALENHFKFKSGEKIDYSYGVGSEIFPNDQDVQTEISVVTSEPVTVRGEGINMGMEVQNQDSNTTMVSIKVSVSESKRNKPKRKFNPKYKLSALSRQRPHGGNNVRERLNNRSQFGLNRQKADQPLKNSVLKYFPISRSKGTEEDLDTQASSKLLAPVIGTQKDTDTIKSEPQIESTNNGPLETQSNDSKILVIQNDEQMFDSEVDSDSLEDWGLPMNTNESPDDIYNAVHTTENLLDENYDDQEEVSERFYKEDLSGRQLGSEELYDSSQEELDSSSEVTENPGYFGITETSAQDFKLLNLDETSEVENSSVSQTNEPYEIQIGQVDPLFDILTPPMLHSGFLPLTPKPKTSSDQNLLPLDQDTKTSEFSGPKESLNDKALLPSESGRSQKITTKIKQAPNGKFYEYEYVYYYYDDEEDLPTDQFVDVVDTEGDTEFKEDTDHTEDNEIPGDGLFFGFHDKSSHGVDLQTTDLATGEGAHTEEQFTTQTIANNRFLHQETTERVQNENIKLLNELPGSFTQSDVSLIDSTGDTFSGPQETDISDDVDISFTRSRGNGQVFVENKKTIEKENRKASQAGKKHTLHKETLFKTDIESLEDDSSTSQSVKQTHRGGLRYSSIQRNRNTPSLSESSLDTDGSSRRLTTSAIRPTVVPHGHASSPRGQGAFDGEPIFNSHPFEDVSVSQDRLPQQPRFPPRVFRPIFESHSEESPAAPPINSFTAIDSTSFRDSFQDHTFPSTLTPTHQTFSPQSFTTPVPHFEFSTTFDGFSDYDFHNSPNQISVFDKLDDRNPKQIKETVSSLNHESGAKDQVIFNLYAFSRALDVDPVIGSTHSPETITHSINVDPHFTSEQVFTTELPTTIDFNTAVETITPNLLSEVKTHSSSDQITPPSFPSGLQFQHPLVEVSEEHSHAHLPTSSVKSDVDHEKDEFMTTVTEKIPTTVETITPIAPVEINTQSRFPSSKLRFGSPNNRLRGLQSNVPRSQRPPPRKSVSEPLTTTKRTTGKIDQSHISSTSDSRPVEKTPSVKPNSRSFSRGSHTFRGSAGVKSRLNPVLLNNLRYGHDRNRKEGEQLASEEPSDHKEELEVDSPTQPQTIQRQRTSPVRRPGDINTRRLPGRTRIAATTEAQRNDSEVTNKKNENSEAKPSLSHPPRKGILNPALNRNRVSPLLARNRFNKNNIILNNTQTESTSEEKIDHVSSTTPSTSVVTKVTAIDTVIDESDDLTLGVTENESEKEDFNEEFDSVTGLPLKLTEVSVQDVTTEGFSIGTSLRVQDAKLKDQEDDLVQANAEEEPLTTTVKVNLLNRIGNRRNQLKTRPRIQQKTVADSPKVETTTESRDKTRRRFPIRLATNTNKPKEDSVPNEVKETETKQLSLARLRSNHRIPVGGLNRPQIRPKEIPPVEENNTEVQDEDTELEENENKVVPVIAIASSAGAPDLEPEGNDSVDAKRDQRSFLLNIGKSRKGVSLFVRQNAMTRS